jgi:hypothetical protein
MIAIQVSEETAKALAFKAEAAGLSLDSYLALLAGTSLRAEMATSDDFDADLDRVALPGPTLPADFSRADIYGEHD